jgi:hypothetical protein
LKSFFLILSTTIGLRAFCQSGAPARANQKDLIDIGKSVLHIHLHPHFTQGKNIQFSFLPISTQAAGPSGLTITATTAAFRLSNDSTGNLSTVTFAPYAALPGRIGFALRSNLWLAGNRWGILGDIRLLYYPQDTWGLGGSTTYSNRLRVDYKYVRFYETILKSLKPSLFAGVGLLIDNRYDLDSPGDSSLLQSFTHYPYGTGATERSTSTGISFNLLYDARKNTLNPLPGYYAHIVYRVDPVWAGSSTSWSSVYLDARKYIPFSREHQNMLAFWAFYWSVLDSHAPYFDLPSVGWDPYQQRSGRGFPQNRYRGKSLLYGETEYRRDLTPNGLLGFVLFLNANAVTEPTTGRFNYIHPAGGAGIRLKFNKKSGTNIALDGGFSKGYAGVYLNLGETF